MKIELGQKVYLKPGTNTGRYDKSIKEGVISKVGRKYYEVVLDGNLGDTHKYLISDSTQVTDYCADYYVYDSLKAIEDEEEIDKLCWGIGQAFSTMASAKDKYSLEQLRRIDNILKEK